jgi:acetyl-CoA carboxylase biotin carboxyl carrier protein
MSDSQIEDSLVQLGEQVRGLARDVPGPLRRVRLSAGEATVEIEWHSPDAPALERPATVQTVQAQQAQAEQAHADPAHLAQAEGTVAAEDQQLVTSPMVGTFYRAESEGAEPFVAVGDLIEVGQTIGIVEAMKLFNPIAAECSGVVLEVLAENAKPVQFGDPLVRLGTSLSQLVGS